MRNPHDSIRLAAAPQQCILRLLVYEDNSADARLVEEALRECTIRCEVVLASSHLDAKSRLAQEAFDLMLSDFGTDFELARKFLCSIRALVPTMPVVVLSGILDARAAYAAGANAFVRKDADVETYFAKIQNLVHFWMRSQNFLHSFQEDHDSTLPAAQDAQCFGFRFVHERDILIRKRKPRQESWCSARVKAYML